MARDNKSDNELVRLEQYIERLLAGYSALKAEKQEVEKQLGTAREERDAALAEIDAMKNNLDSLDSERGAVRDRVNSLIGQIEQWEAEMEMDAADDTAGEDSGDVVDEEPEDTEDPVESDDEENKGDNGDGAKAQKNLFSA